MAVARALHAGGCQADAAQPGAIPPGGNGVIFLGFTKPGDDTRSATAVNREAFACARAVAGELSSGAGVFVTVQDTGGDFGLSGAEAAGAWAAGLPGLAKTVAIEWPGVHAKAIDLERRGETALLANRLAEEILFGGDEIEVGLRADGERVTVTTAAADLQTVTPATGRIASGVVLVASGGARGVTAASLVELARAIRPRVALLGRTALSVEPDWAIGLVTTEAMQKVLVKRLREQGQTVTPREIQKRTEAVLHTREIRATLEDIKRAGGEGLYLEVDIGDGNSVRAALGRVRAQWGPIQGLIHGAGVLADKPLAQKTDEQFQRVFDTKVEGLRNLLEATAEDPLEMICLFSSVAARVGNAGQSDYAMANEVLNKVAAAEARRRGAGCVVKSLNWGPWEGGMVTPALKHHFEGMGVPLIPLDWGARRFAQEMIYGRDRAIEVVFGGDPALGLGGEGRR